MTLDYPWQQDAAMKESVGDLIRLNAARAKIGRNDPCPCQSGQKYKKCCGIE
jgi:uncharacterized protein